MRSGETYDTQNYSDLYGNHATNNWNPRQCAKGYTFHRILYGPYRLRHPIVRKGWKAWADAGFPELTPELKSKYLFDARGQDEFIQITWEDAFRNIAGALQSISSRYSGSAGRQKLLAQGYQPEMVEETGGAGTRCIKMRGGMGLLGVLGKYGMYRLNNSLALLDSRIRGVGADQALGGRNWSNYTWHGDQAPGHPWVHGLQASDCDFNDLRYSKLIIMDGKNLVENKLADSHWFIECMERGGTIVVIAPEYGPPSTKADYWIPIRPATDAALWLGVTKLLIDRKTYDEDFVKRFTDFPLLVRTDNLRRLRAHEVFQGYKSPLSAEGPSMKIQGMSREQHEELGDFVVWDVAAKAPRPITRDQIGKSANFTPALEGTWEVRLAKGGTVRVATLWTWVHSSWSNVDWHMRVAWDTWIDGRLLRRGWAGSEVRQKRYAEFAATFSACGPEVQQRFLSFFDSDNQTHDDLLRFAQQPGGRVRKTARGQAAVSDVPLVPLPFLRPAGRRHPAFGDNWRNNCRFRPVAARRRTLSPVCRSLSLSGPVAGSRSGAAKNVIFSKPKVLPKRPA